MGGMKPVSFETTKAEAALITEIVRRAVKEGLVKFARIASLPRDEGRIALSDVRQWIDRWYDQQQTAGVA